MGSLAFYTALMHIDRARKRRRAQKTQVFGNIRSKKWSEIQFSVWVVGAGKFFLAADIWVQRVSLKGYLQVLGFYL